MDRGVYDIAVIGGGVNGCGIARDAAGRGLSVFLAEQNDLGGGTSSASTKLIHGGLRYLEHYEIRMVRASLAEREVLLGTAPHIIWPLRVVLPHHAELRPAWLIRLGLFLYDHLGVRQRLPACRSIDLVRDPAGAPLDRRFSKGVEYSDCWVDDARLVVLNAVDAARRGADVRVRSPVRSAVRSDGLWDVEVSDAATGQVETIRARALVNATGPWIADFTAGNLRVNTSAHIRLVKGSHIVVPRMFDHDRAYIFQNADRRIVFAIPYQHDFTLVGTTDVDFTGDPATAAASDEEIAYLCSAISEYFSVPISRDAVVWSYSGVRPLFDSGESAAQEANRDYVLELNGAGGEPALLNIFGGKITTYRHLAEEALAKLNGHVPPMGLSWTRSAPLPGGDFPVDGFDTLVEDIVARHACVDMPLATRLARAYGTVAFDILSGVETSEDLGRHFGAGLYERELVHLIRNEWASTVEDVLWRRSKLGLRMSDQEASGLARWLSENRAAIAGSEG